MKKVYFSGFMLLIAAISAGCSQKCYSCSSTLNEDCKDPVKYSMKPKLCGMGTLNETKHYAGRLDQRLFKYFEVDLSSQEPQIPTNCLKQVTKVGNREVIIRGCQLAPTETLDICKKVLNHQSDNLQVTHCTLCNSDACNSSFVGTVPFITVFFATAFAWIILKI